MRGGWRRRGTTAGGESGGGWGWGSVGRVEPAPSTKQLLRWSEALAGIARTGLGFTESLYEQERFEEILRVAADIRVAVDEGADGAEDAHGLVEEWLSTVGKGGQMSATPPPRWWSKKSKRRPASRSRWSASLPCSTDSEWESAASLCIHW